MKPGLLHARMIDANTISAGGITISAGDPIQALCRKLVKDGYDPSLSLKVWRGERPIRLIHAISNPDIHINLHRKQESAA